MRVIISILALTALVASAIGTGAQVITEDFAGYPEGAVAGARWEVDGLGWAVRNGRLTCEAGTRTTATPAAAPHCRIGTIEAVLRVDGPIGKEWKTAGILFAQDEANHWQLALVESPTALGSKRSMELHEMRAGHWLADIEGETTLKKTSEEGMFEWEYGREYRMRLELTDDGILGTIEEIGTARSYRVAYAFSAPAVQSGRPQLAASSFAVAYSSLSVRVHQTAPAPVRPKPKPYSLRPMSSIKARATGYFRVAKLGDRWWVIDPKGYAFYVVGTDHVNYRAHWCEKLGYAPYSRNVQAKYGTEEKWAASAAERLKAWGFNTLGAGHSESVRYRGLAHTVFLSFGTAFTAFSDIVPRTTWTGFPDVFDPRFAEYCAIEARRQCAPHRDDPWLLGYFLDNELEWFGKNGSETGIADEMMKKPPSHPAKRAFLELLKQRHASIEALNAAWKTSYASWEALAGETALPPEASLADRRAFVRLTADRYFAATCAAIRQADPNHMILGCRFAMNAPGIWDIAGRYLDIVSVNYYGNVDLVRGTTTDMPAAMARYHRESRRPLMITEWSFPALDAGLPSRHGAGQRVPTQRDKARAYQIYQTALFGMPYMVGSDYFMWVDEPALGISSTFPEDSNYGLVDVNDRAWPELTAMAAQLNPRAVAIHSNQTAEVSAQVRNAGIVVRNRGTREARFTADVWVQGVHTTRTLRIAPQGSQTLRLRIAGPSLVVVELDRAGVLAEARLDDNRTVGIVGAPASGRQVLVANPGDAGLTNLPVVVRLPKGAGPHAVMDAAGKTVPAQVDRLPNGDELAFVAPKVAARSVAVFRLKAGGATSRMTRGTEDGFTAKGALNVAWNGTSGNVLDSVRLGDLPMGRLTMLVHQVNGQPLWTEPSRTLDAVSWEGPVRTVRIVELEGGGDLSAARTAVDREGVYAPRTGVPHRFRMTVRLDWYPGEPWFDVRVLRVASADTEPWRLESCFVYALSAIGGSANDDSPGGIGDAPRWYDAGADASYGAIMDTRVFRGSYWKDTPDGPGEHADIYRMVQRVLQPGEAFAPEPPDPAVRVFAVRGDSAAGDNAGMQRVRALSRLDIRVLWR
jgi:hypothetical protein